MSKTSDAQREAQAKYNDAQKERGYYQTRPWLPVEMEDWHRHFVLRCREWKEFGTPLELPPLPAKMTRPLKAGRK